MCGIAGVVKFTGGFVNEATIKAMCQAMIHRGPDDEGIYLNNHDAKTTKIGNIETSSVALGHRRLSIIDLSTAGHQPMANEDRSVWLTLNGEIYNYKDLRLDLEKKHKFFSNTDSEVLLHLYEDYGKDCVRYLRGMFSFGIWDENKKLLLLGRDRVGKKPLFYSHQNEKFLFASELSALRASNLLKFEISYEAIDYYLTFGYIPSPLTIYKNVFKLPPASILILHDGGENITIENYWRLDFAKKVKISEGEAAEETFRLLEEAVKIRLYSDVPLGAFLSGGIDSSAVVGLMAGLSNKKIKTFSIGFDETDFNELKFAKTISQKFDTEHHEFIVRPNALEIFPLLVERYGEPYADSSAIPTYYVSRQTKQFVTVALNGDGGDELFAGYERYQAILISEIYNKIPFFLREVAINKIVNYFPDSINPKNRLRRIKRFVNGTIKPLDIRYLQWNGIFNDDEKNEIYNEDFGKKFLKHCSVDFISCFMNNPKKVSLLDRLLTVDINTYLPGDLLAKVDVASMANSLEARSPFLDHHLMEFAASLPSSYKIKGFNKKFILKKAVSKLLPKENINRRKMGFGVPIGSWLRGELKFFLRETLLSQKSLSRGYFKPDKIKYLVENHIKGYRDYSGRLWALLMLELWHMKFED